MAFYQREFYISRGLLKKDQTFSIDFGGTLIKVAYIGEDETEEGLAKLHLATFNSNELSEACEFLKQHVTYKSGTNVTLTGLRSSEDRPRIEKALNVKVSLAGELDVFSRAFHMLKNNFPEKFYTLEGVATTDNELADKVKNIRTTGKGEVSLNAENSNSKTPTENSSGQSDVVLMLGSGATLTKYNADGSHNFLTGSSTCGQTLLGLGRLLTEAKTFDELMKLASAGDFREVHRCGRDFKSNTAGDEGNAYSKFPDDCILHQFGKASEKPRESFKKEDLAASLVSCLLENLSLIGYQTCILEKVNKLYVCGSMIEGSEMMRLEFAKAWARQTAILGLKSPVEIKFCKYGAHTAAIGALLKED